MKLRNRENFHLINYSVCDKFRNFFRGNVYYEILAFGRPSTLITRYNFFGATEIQWKLPLATDMNLKYLF